jgi:hypothetical protein
VIRISWRNCGGNRILKCCHTENGDFHVYYNTSQPFVIHLLSFVIHLVTRVEKLTNWSFACKKIEMKKTMKSSISAYMSWSGTTAIISGWMLLKKLTGGMILY